ncbi:MAG TPA: polyprenyl diphosphate synthase [Dehalococcoidales bacterium]|nr:polyprenyl diphosphate synthase [Dehalococcoidales bacterium]
MMNPVQKFKALPHHVAIVPDGNGRWAKQRGLPRIMGHRAGTENMLRMVQWISEYPIPYVTFYGFSTENWHRPSTEVLGLFDVVVKFVDSYLKDIQKANIKIRHIGTLQGLPQSLQDAITRSVESTKENTGMNLGIAWNYGGRAEIVEAAANLMREGYSPDKLDEKVFAEHLYTAGMPDVDLLIRTGDETRLSNFLIWQTAYAEYYFTKILWPDFGKKEIEAALLDFSNRDRRFGRVK